MSYNNDKKAFDATAKRLLSSANKSGVQMSYSEAKNKLREHLQKSQHKKQS